MPYKDKDRDKQFHKEYDTIYYPQNRNKIKRRKAEITQQLRTLVFIKLGGKCKGCGISDFRVLQIDHIQGLGKQDRKRFKTYNAFLRYLLLALSDEELKQIYQVLCANCNIIKAYERGEFIVTKSSSE